jgi:hypothetical protein
MPATISKTDIIPLVNIAWARSFARRESNKKAISMRGWNPLNRGCLENPEVLATKPAPKETTQEDSPTFTGGAGSSLTTRLNVTEGAGAIEFEKLLTYADSAAAKQIRQENKDKGAKVADLATCAKNITSGMLFGMGHVGLGPDLLVQVQGRTDKKNADVQKNEDKKKAKFDETWDKAQSLKEKAETTWTVADLKTMVTYKTRNADSPHQKRKKGLLEQWKNRKNRTSPQRTRASTEEIPDVLLPSLQPWLDQGSATIAKILPELTSAVQDTLDTLAAHLGHPFLVLGSWPALKIVQSMNDERLQATLSKLKANDIDVYQGFLGNGECEIVYQGITKARVEDVNFEVNIVPVKNFNAQSLLASNDINATAVAINVYETEPGQPVKFTVEASAHFWEFILSERHVLKAVNPSRAKARSLVRMAYKAFEMGLPFDDSSIDPGSEVLYRSHKEKVDEMKDWADSPFANMRLERAENEGNAFWLKEQDMGQVS